jgi:hypothetical protein
MAASGDGHGRVGIRMARPLGQVLCNAAGQRPHSRSQPRPARQSGLFGISDNMSYTLHFGADYDETRNEYKMEFCDETLRKYIGTRNSNLAFATRKRIALQFLYGLNYIHSQGFLHRRRCGSGCPATLNISEASATKTFSASMRSGLPSARVTSNAVVDGVWFISGAFPRTRPATTPARWVPVRRADRALP